MWPREVAFWAACSFGTQRLYKTIVMTCVGVSLSRSVVWWCKRCLCVLEFRVFRAITGLSISPFGLRQGSAGPCWSGFGDGLDRNEQRVAYVLPYAQVAVQIELLHAVFLL